MNRGIDHLVLGVHDLDKARDTYARLGFTTTPRAIHPFGTGNSLVQLQGNFLELLAVVDESKFAAPAAGAAGSGGGSASSGLRRRRGRGRRVVAPSPSHAVRVPVVVRVQVDVLRHVPIA